MPRRKAKPGAPLGADNVPRLRVERFLERSGLDQKGLAEAIGMDAGQLSRVLTGRGPGQKIWEKISEFMKVDIGDLLSPVWSQEESFERHVEVEAIDPEERSEQVTVSIDDYRALIEWAYHSTLSDTVIKSMESLRLQNNPAMNPSLMLLEHLLSEHERIRTLVRRNFREHPGFFRNDSVYQIARFINESTGDGSQGVSVKDMERCSQYLDKIQNLPNISQDLRSLFPQGELSDNGLVDIANCARILKNRRLISDSDEDFLKLVNYFVEEQRQRLADGLDPIDSSNQRVLLDFFDGKLNRP